MRRLAGVSVGWLGISMVADGLPALLVPYRAVSDGLDATAIGLVTLVAIATGALVQLMAGRWSDRVGRAPVVAIGVVVAAVGLMLVLQPGALLPGAVLSLAGVGLAQAGYQALMPDHMDASRRGLASGAKGLFDVGGAFVAFILLGWLLGAGRPEFAGPVLIIGLLLALGMGVALLHGSRRRREPRALDTTATSLPPGFVPAVVARFVFLLAIFGVGRFLFSFLAERSGGAASDVAAETATVLALLTLVTAAAALPAGWLADRVGRAALMAAGGAIAAVGMATLATASGMPSVLVAGGMMAIGSAAFGAGNWASLADASAGARTGRLLGIANLGTAGAAAAAGLFGPVIDAANGALAGAGFAVAFGIAAVLAAVGGGIGWRSAASGRPDRANVLQAADG